MQKKILLSLLMASPTAFPALANINLGSGNWNSQGVTGQDVTIDNESGSVTNYLGGGVTQWNVGELQPGTYKLSFATFNNLSVEILLNGESFVTSTGTTEFTLEQAGNVTIVTKGTTAGKYEFTGANLELIFDFQAVGDALQAQLDALTGYVVITDLEFPGAEELMNEQTSLNETKTALQELIDQLKNTATSVKDLMAIYNGQELWKAPEDKLTTAISDLNDQIEEWNENATALNTAIKNTADNKAAKAQLLAEQAGLLDQIETLIEEISNGSKYGQDQNLGAANDLKAEIEAYENAINEAYADDKLAGEIEFESQTDALQNKIDTLINDWQNDENDWNAYQTFMNTIFPDLQNAYNDAVAAINALEGVEGMEDNFASQKNTVLENVANVYNDAKAALNITSAEGAAALLEGDQETVKDAKDAINDLVNNLTNLVNTQNSNYTTAAGQINDFTEALDDIKDQCKVVPDSLSEAYNEAVSNIETLLNELQEYVTENYNNAELEIGDGSEYATQVEAIQEALDNLNTLVEPILGINQLLNGLEELKKYIQEEGNKLGTEFINLYDIFNKQGGTFAAIEDAINNLKPEEVAGQKDDIQDAIDDAYATADKLVDVFTKLKVADGVYSDDAAALQAFVDAKIEIDENGKAATDLKKAFMAADGKGGEFIAAQQQFNQDIKDAVAEGKSPQQIYDAAVSLFNQNITVTGEGEEAEVTYNWQAGLETIKIDFAKEVTDSNKANLDALIASVKAEAADGTYAGQDTFDFTEIDSAAAEIVTAIAAATTIEAYGDADQDILDLIPDIDAIRAKVAAYKQNQADYDAFIATLDGTIQDGINALIAQNNKESKDNGLAYFANLINGEDNENSLQAQLDGIKSDLAEALGQYADPENNVTGQKSDFDIKINALKNLIEKTANDITANNTAHTQQLNTAEEVAEAIVAALEQLEEYYQGQTGIDDWYNETKEDLVNLRDNDLFNNNVAVADAYGKGLSFTNDKVLTDEYNRIKDEIESIVNSMRDEFAQAVVDANAAVVTESGWEGLKSDLNAEYVSAISTFNAYYFGLTNEGWKKKVFEIDGFEARHEEIYQYSQAINDLIAAVNKYISDKNKVPATFTSDEFQAEAIDKANTLIEEMQQKVDKLNTDVAAAAEEYYNELRESAENQIAGYESQLNAAGIPLDCLDEVKDALADAISGYEAATAEDATELIGIAMDRIADNLDKANTEVNLQTVAEDAWNTLYGDSKSDVEGILDALRDLTTEDYKFADESVRNTAIVTIETLLSDMEDLNDEATGVHEGLIDEYAGYKSDLENLLDQINNAVQTVKDDSANNLESKNLYDSMTTATLPDLEEAYNALLEYSQSMAGGQTFDIASIRTAIDNLTQFVENKAASLAANKDYIEQTVEDINNSIENGYSQIAYNEYNYLLNTLLGKVKVAFNNAKAAYNGATGTTSNLGADGEEKLNGWNNDIDGYESAITALNLLINTTDFDEDEFRTKALELEQQLCDMYVTLEQSWTSDKHDGANPLDAVLTALEEQYNEVLAAIEAAEEYLQNCEEGLDTTEYAEDLANAREALDNVKEAWTNAENRALTMQPTYAADMETINNNVADTLAALTAANEKAIADAAAKAANEAAYVRLTGELDDLKAELERVIALRDSWYPTEYVGRINTINSLINSNENNLETRYENGELTETSTLNNTHIGDLITSLETDITIRRVEETRGWASTALYNANSLLNANSGRIVPEELESLQETLQGLYDAYWDNYDKQTDVSNVTLAVYNECITEYERIQTEAETLQTTITENTYVPGDVNLNPDGRVTAVDVQMILNWILKGVTWEELKAENPRQAYAADLNGDQTLNITDVTMDIALVFGQENPRVAGLQRIAAAPRQENNASMGLTLVSEENGVRRYAVTVDNTMSIIAGQLDIKLPSGMRITDITTAERNGSHEVESYDESSRLTRVAIYSMENAAFEANSGAVLYIDVEGSGELKVDNMILTDINYNTIVLESGNHSLVNSIMEGARDMGTRIYNTAGMMLNRIQKGINIFRSSDGKVKKEINRK